MTLDRPARRLALALLVSALATPLAPPLAAQPACAPLPAARGATFTFGTEGGNLRPGRVRVRADGRVSRDGAAAPRVAAARVASLAQLARTGGFWTLRAPPITRPPANPDAARRFITVHLTCGTRRAEYAGSAPAAFDTLFARLGALAGG